MRESIAPCRPEVWKSGPRPYSSSRSHSVAARGWMENCRGEPWFMADWVDVLMCHLEVDPDALQRATPFPIDHYQGRAFVSLVFFTLRNMRPRAGGWLSRFLFQPIATHRFLNVRTYVQQAGESGIYFLSEWLPNRISVCLGPSVFGLPYRLGSFAGENRPELGCLTGKVADARTGQAVQFSGGIDKGLEYAPCQAGSLEEWLMERYTAFTQYGRRARYFRVWHPPWHQVSAEIELHDEGLLRGNWAWMEDAALIGSNYSHGFQDIWMGRPRRLR